VNAWLPLGNSPGKRFLYRKVRACKRDENWGARTTLAAKRFKYSDRVIDRKAVGPGEKGNEPYFSFGGFQPDSALPWASRREVHRPDQSWLAFECATGADPRQCLVPERSQIDSGFEELFKQSFDTITFPKKAICIDCNDAGLRKFPFHNTETNLKIREIDFVGYLAKYQKLKQTLVILSQLLPKKMEIAMA